MAGKPARAGSLFAGIAGALVLFVGLSVTLGVGLLTFALSTPGIAVAVALPLALITLTFGGLLVGGARQLGRAGSRAEKDVREQALLAIVAERGAATAAQGAAAAGLSVAEADAILTAIAKREPERLAVDVDEQGAVWFRAVAWGPHVRVASDSHGGASGGGPDPNVRVGVEGDPYDDSVRSPPMATRPTKDRR